MLNDSTVKALRKLKDGSGELYLATVRAGGSAGHDFEPPIFYVFICTGNCSRTKIMAFGDFSYYWIADRQGRSFKRLNELFGRFRVLQPIRDSFFAFSALQ